MSRLPRAIVLNEYVRARDLREPSAGYQSEKDLEDDLIRDLQTWGYEYLPQLNNPEALLSNARTQLEKLNNLTFTDSEWERFLVEYLDKPGTPTIEQTRRVQVDHICDFKFDDEHLQIVYLVDKDNVRRNRLQPWYTHDLFLLRHFRCSRRIEGKLTFAVNNIYNQQYEVIANYPMPGRTLNAALDINF